MRAFESAYASGFRGYFWFPSLDPVSQMPETDRVVVSKKINWLYNNAPWVRPVIDGLSLDEVDTGIWPKAVTSSPEFNKAATDRFHESWKDPRFFDSRQCESIYSAQLAVRRHIRLFGEHFGQFLRPDETHPFARVHFIPAYQVSAERGNERFPDAVRTDPLGAPLEYRIRVSDTPERYETVPAADLLHFHDPFWTGQKRAMAGLAPIASKLFKLDEIQTLMANGIQLRTMMAYAIERQRDDSGGPTPIPGVVGREEVTNPDGSKTFVQQIVSPTGQEVAVAEPPAGRTIKVLESNRPDEPLAFKHDILTDLAYCTGYPPAYVFALAQGNLGTEVRWLVRRVQTVKSTVRQFQLIPQFLEPAYRFRLWQDIKRGFFDDVGVPPDWYKAKWICPEDTSVDIGREGKLYDERLARGELSPEDYHGKTGRDASDVEDEVLATRARRHDKLDEINTARAAQNKRPLTYEEVWPATSQAAANSAFATPPADPSDNPPA